MLLIYAFVDVSIFTRLKTLVRGCILVLEIEGDILVATDTLIATEAQNSIKYVSLYLCNFNKSLYFIMDSDIIHYSFITMATCSFRLA